MRQEKRNERSGGGHSVITGSLMYHTMAFKTYSIDTEAKEGFKQRSEVIRFVFLNRYSGDNTNENKLNFF